MPRAPEEVIIYTDGACESNPGPGGYGAVLLYGRHRKELAGGYRRTTNNRMEILAAIKALEALKEPCTVTLYSDSQYLVQAMMEGWAERWRKRNWWRTSKEPALNIDLWQRLLAVCEQHAVTFVWVEGHTGVPENERCDQLSVTAARQPDLPPDEGYENPLPPPEPIKLTQAGQPCRRCETPLLKKISKKGNYYLHCPHCQADFAFEGDEADRSAQGRLF